jgi:hypothetical protein
VIAMADFGAVLLSAGPDPQGLPELMQFGRFVGAWDLDVIYYATDGTVTRRVPGEWHFGWALEGRAVADVWIVPPRAQRDAAAPPAGEYGMSLRFYDRSIAGWRSTWLGPVHHVVYPFLARQIGESMVLERIDSGRIIRWSFRDITAESFTWDNSVSSDDGKTWLLEQKFLARRVLP